MLLNFDWDGESDIRFCRNLKDNLGKAHRNLSKERSKELVGKFLLYLRKR
jgi:hypothetical protein